MVPGCLSLRRHERALLCIRRNVRHTHVERGSDFQEAAGQEDADKGGSGRGTGLRQRRARRRGRRSGNETHSLLLHSLTAAAAAGHRLFYTARANQGRGSGAGVTCHQNKHCAARCTRGDGAAAGRQ
jgi:hypothetical protein